MCIRNEIFRLGERSGTEFVHKTCKYQIHKFPFWNVNIHANDGNALSVTVEMGAK